MNQKQAEKVVDALENFLASRDPDAWQAEFAENMRKDLVVALIDEEDSAAPST